jgi:hydrogenase/urease accessory protein HupE
MTTYGVGTGRRSRRLFCVPLVTACVLAAWPAAAWAHKLGFGSDPNRPVLEYVWLGFLHMAAGWDHLLFITGVVLLADTVGRAAKLISLFVLGHSITLLLATIAGWQLNATVVDVVIALSVAYVGVQGVRGRPPNWRVTGAVVFAFGLVHGLGLSTRLQDLGLPDEGVVGRVVLFNVGVELGQLAALSVIVGVGTLLVRRIPRSPAVSRVGFGALIAAGLIAAGVLSLPSGELRESEQSIASSSCQEAGYKPEVPPVGDHPEESFYRPGEQFSGFDLLHVMHDGYVVVRYAESLPARQRRALEAWVLEGDLAVIGAPDDDQVEPIRVLTEARQLTCSRVELATLTTFRDRWFESLRS